MYALPHVKPIASGKLLYKTGSPTQCFCATLEGWDGLEDGREGTYVYLWLVYIVVWQKPIHCIAFILQLKKKNEEEEEAG